MKLSKTAEILIELGNAIAPTPPEPSQFGKMAAEKRRLIEGIKMRGTTKHEVDRMGERRTLFEGRHLETMSPTELREIYERLKHQTFASMYGGGSMKLGQVVTGSFDFQGHHHVPLGNHGSRLSQLAEKRAGAAKRAEASFKALGGVLPGDPEFDRTASKIGANVHPVFEQILSDWTVKK